MLNKGIIKCNLLHVVCRAISSNTSSMQMSHSRNQGQWRKQFFLQSIYH